MNVKRFFIIYIFAVLVVATLSGCRNGTAEDESSSVKDELPAITSSFDGTVTPELLPPQSEQPTATLSPSQLPEQTQEATESSIYAAALAEFMMDTMDITASVQADLDDDGIKEMVAFTGTDNAGYAVPIAGSSDKVIGNEARLVIFSEDQGEIQMLEVSDNYAYTLANSTNYRLYISASNHLILEQTGHDDYNVYIYKLDNGEMLEAKLGYGQSSAWFTDFDGTDYYNKERYTYQNREFGEFLRSKMIKYGVQNVSASLKDWSEKRISSVHGSTSTSAYSEVYLRSKIEFENAIEFAVQKSMSYASKVRGIELDYDWGILQSFEEMLQYRESLEDANESLGLLLSERYDFPVWISDVAFFTDGGINYRLLLFGSLGLPLDRLYIQIYDNVYYEFCSFGDYVHEGGTSQSLLYSIFLQDSDRNYMVIIDKEEHEATETITHYITNYEIKGMDIVSYIALKEELSEGIWQVTGESRYYDHLSSVKIYNSDTRSWPENWWSSQETFEDNIFTIILNNESRDEISLLFQDGFWEVIQVK